jgi:hypothetical protein
MHDTLPSDRRTACRTLAACVVAGLPTYLHPEPAANVGHFDVQEIMRNPLLRHLLVTDSPHPLLGDAAAVFDRFVGSWAMDCVFTAVDGAQTTISGEWHFGWILAGRAMQDVLYFYPKGQRPTSQAEMRGGTTLRLFDPKSRQWQVSWFAALRGEVIHLRGGAEGGRIVLRGLDVDGAPLRWSFNDVQDDRFRWLGETSADGGSTWRVEQEMQLQRMSDGGRP